MPALLRIRINWEGKVLLTTLSLMTLFVSLSRGPSYSGLIIAKFPSKKRNSDKYFTALPGKFLAKTNR